MTRNKMSNIDFGIGIIKNSILDNLEKHFKNLDLDDLTLTTIIETIENEKTAAEIPKKSRKKVINLDRPKREIAPANQCQRIMKNGEKCRGIKTNDVTKSCWGHMTPQEREAHRLSKSKPAVTGKKYSVHRKAEDEADE
jgi:hypothetical protein